METQNGFVGFRRLGAIILLLVATFVAATCTLYPSAEASPVSYRLAMIQVLYSDTIEVNYTVDQLSQAALELQNYFRWLSYGNLEMQINVVRVNLSQTQSFYSNPCATDGSETRIPCPPPLVEDAAQTAAGGGFDFTDIDGILIISPCPCCGVTFPPITISRPGISGTFEHAYVDDCLQDPRLNAPGASGVLWEVWAHEIGHQLQDFTYGDWAHAGHPAGYASGYDLMDSCYPCHDSAYSLSGSPTVSERGHIGFPGWLSSSKVVTVEAPAADSTGETVVLAPLSQDSSATTAAQAIKIPIAPGYYYLVEARKRIQADSLDIGPGIWDEGVHILEVEESRNPPVRLIDSCDTLVPGGCVRSDSDDRYLNCFPAAVLPRRRGDVPDYCWPYPLWHVGQAYNDSTNAIQIRTDAVVGDGYAVTVTRGVPPGYPDVFVLPWLTPPMDTWESVDIWVDSSCNGYEDAVGPSGLRYGRRADGTVIGNGDNPCANHENRIYAKIRNGGDRTANDVRVTFKVTDPLGVGIRGAAGWTVVGTVTSAEFPPLAALAPGTSTDVYVRWVPTVSLTEVEIAAGRFNFHSCVQVLADAVSGEIVTSNQDGDGEQENINYFEARLDAATGVYESIGRDFYIRNFGPNEPLPEGLLGKDGEPRTFYLDVKSGLPTGWTYSVADGRRSLTLAPGEIRLIPVKIIVPPGTPTGESYLLKVRAYTKVLSRNEAIPEDWPYLKAEHEDMVVVAGVTLTAQTVTKTNLSLAGKWNKKGYISLFGRLKPSPGAAIVALDYTNPKGSTTTRLVKTNKGGVFKDKIPVQTDGSWKLRALWQGSSKYSSAASQEVIVKVGK